MLVKWNENCVKFAEYNGTKFTFLPGINDVPVEDWEVLSPILVDEIKASRIVPLFAAKAKDGSAVYKAFTDLEARDAVQAVSETYSLAALNAWLDMEGRSDVRAKLQSRIADVESQKAK